MAIAEPLATIRSQLGRVPEVAAALTISRSKIYQMMDSGELPFVKLGGSRRIRWSDVEKLVNKNTHGAE